MATSFPSDIEIARQATLRPITEIAARLGLQEADLEPYGRHKAKLPLKLSQNPTQQGKLILVSAITPTPAGEGKTTVSIGLADGLNRIGKKTIAVLREPSLGPVFGIKGGATGGGHAQVIPMEDINLHFTGDFAAIEKANNLLAALIDNNLQSSRSLNIDTRSISWKRVMDMNDRALRNLVCGLGGMPHGVPRESGFDITAASEIMAILCMATDLSDLKERMSRIFVGFTKDKKPVYARDINAQGAMAALLKDAVKPNLIQTLEGNPAIMHGGPFANIAQGTNTIIATKTGLQLADYVVTEAGFGFDLGGEKFLDIKCQAANLSPCAVVLVATVRALKYHGGVERENLGNPDPKAVANGMANLKKHIENIRLFNIIPVVALNAFATDSPEEHEIIRTQCAELGIRVARTDGWERGGAGAEDLAQLVAETADACTTPFTPLYSWTDSVREKIETIATRIYGASHVEYSPRALADMKKIADLGLENFPICMAKTQSSLSDQPALRGCPTNFPLTIREIEIAAGAGFLVPLTGTMMRMPGLPTIPAAEHIDINEHGQISGLF